MSNLFLGIDGGGTYTRAAIADAEGHVCASVKRQGGAFLAKNPNAVADVHSAVEEAARQAGCALGDIAALTAGVAGYDKRRDLRWVKKLTNVSGLACAKQHVNDAAVAVRGAFCLRPGIAAIGGTGSIVAGMTEQGKLVRNYDFRHYANVSALWLSRNAVQKLVLGEADASDHELINAVLRALGVEDISRIKPLKDYSMKAFSDLGPVITEAALKGSHIAENVCRQAAGEVVEGIRLVGSRFKVRPVSVALIGSAINSTVVKQEIAARLADDPDFVLKEAALPPVLGAVLMAMQSADTAINEHIATNLRKGAEQP